MAYSTGATILRPAGYGGCSFAHFLYTVALLILGLRGLGRWIGGLLPGWDLGVWEPVGTFNIFLGILWLGGLIMAIVSKKGAAEKMEESLVEARKLGINGIISLAIVVLIVSSFEIPSWLLSLILLGGLLLFIVYQVYDIKKSQDWKQGSLGDNLVGYIFFGILAIIALVIALVIAGQDHTLSHKGEVFYSNKL